MSPVVSSLKGILETHPFFAGLADPYLDLLAGCARNERFEGGAYLYRENQDADRLFLIREGRVSLEVYSTRRGPISFAQLGEGDVLGTSWIVPPFLAGCDARALEPVRALTLDGVCMRGKCDQDPALGYELMKRSVAVLIARLEAAQMQLIDLYRDPEPHREPAKTRRVQRRAGR